MSSHYETYPERESKTLEFKSCVPSFLSLIKTCVAFSNTAGGNIIIGVEDGTRKIIGVTEKDRNRIYDDFQNSLYDSTSPGLFAHIYEKNLNDHAVLIITIPYGVKLPCFVKKEGIPKGVYVRVGASNRRAQDTYVQDLIREGKRNYYDEEATRAKLSDLSKTLLSECYGTSYTEKKLLSESVIANSARNNQYNATVAGVLMFSEQPEKFIPEASVLCTQFSGKTGRKIIQTHELNGPIPVLADNTLQLLTSWLEKSYELYGAKLKGKLPIPKIALREAIINALLHRKYTVVSAVKVALYDDRLEIFSPGAFPGLIDLNNLGDGTTFLRNPHLARIGRRFHLIEKLGTGIKLIFNKCRELGIKKPQYYEDGDFVKLVFSLSPSVDATDNDKDAIVHLMSMRDGITISDVMELLGVSRNTATRKLNLLIKEGHVVRKGKGPATRYLLS